MAESMIPQGWIVEGGPELPPGFELENTPAPQAPSLSWGDLFSGSRESRDAISSRDPRHALSAKILGTTPEAQGRQNAGFAGEALAGVPIAGSLMPQTADMTELERDRPGLATTGRVLGGALATAPLVAAFPAAFGATGGLAARTAMTGLSGGALAGTDQAARDALAGTTGQPKNDPSALMHMFGIPSTGYRAADAALTAGGIGAASVPVASAAGALLAPQVLPEAQRLYNAGVEVTPSQAIGGRMRSITNKLSSAPLVGENIADNTANSMESFQRSRMNLALSRINHPPMPEDMPLDRNAVEYVSDAISRHFQQHIPLTVAALDRQFAADMGMLSRRAAAELPPPQQADFNRIIRNYVVEPFNSAAAQTGQPRVPGAIAQNVDRTLGEFSTRLRSQNNPAWDQRVGSYIRETQERFRDMLIRSSPPDASQGVQEARRAFAEYVPVRDAAAVQGAEQGRFTPNQYKNAVRQQAVTREQYATNTGNPDYRARQQAAEDAVRVLPNRIPDSGTAGRHATTELALALLAGHGNPYLTAGIAGSYLGTTGTMSRLGAGYVMNPGLRAPVAEALRRLGPQVAAQQRNALAGGQ
jgi:hypothetical protein